MTLQAPLFKGEKKPETCEEQLRRMCKSIANGISEPEEITDEETGEKRTESAGDWMEGVYDIRYIVDREKRYFSAELLVAGGGPTIWVNLNTREVEGYWGWTVLRCPSGTTWN